MFRWVVVFALCVVAGSCGACSACQSDGQRAAAERAKIEEKAKDAWALLPYRAVKAVSRSSAAPNRPQAFDALEAAFVETTATEKIVADKSAPTAAETAQLALSYGHLLAAIVRMRGELRHHDEDEFPFLWTAMHLEPAPPAFYDNGLEHLGLATVWLVLDVADPGDRIPAGDVELYELSRSTVAPAWPWVLRTWARLARGSAWCVSGYHYAADEELTRYLAELEEPGPEAAFVFGALEASPEQAHGSLRAAGLLMRAYNRLELGRRGLAVDDVESALAELDKIGVKNELTLWGHAFVDFHHGRYPEAAAALDELAASPYVDDKARAEIKQSADDLRKNGEHPAIFQRGRGLALVGRALVARAGGPEAILARVVGPDRAATMLAPVTAIDRARQGLARAVTDEEKRGVDKVKALIH